MGFYRDESGTVCQFHRYGPVVLRINRNRNAQRYTRKSEIDRAGFWRFRYYSEFYGALHRVASLLFRLLKRCMDESSREGAALGLFPLLFSLAGAEGFRARLAARARYGAYGPLRPMPAKAFHALRTMGPFRVRIPELGTTWLDAEEGGR